MFFTRLFVTVVASLLFVSAAKADEKEKQLPEDLLEFAVKLKPKDALIANEVHKRTIFGEITAPAETKFIAPPKQYNDSCVVILSANSLGAYSAIDPEKVDVYAVQEGKALLIPKISETQYTNDAGNKLYLFVGPQFNWNRSPYGPGCVFVLLKK